MRAWTLVIGLMLSVLFGGTGFAMSGTGCGHAAAAETIPAVHHESEHGSKSERQDDCCSGAGLCRMASCAPLITLTQSPEITAMSARLVFHAEAEHPVKGLLVSPPHGPPRLILS